jgi:ATP-dependent RNA helicase DDX43
MTRSDWGSAKELIDILQEANQEIPQELHEMATRFEAKKARGGFSRGSFRGRDNSSRMRY